MNTNLRILGLIVLAGIILLIIRRFGGVGEAVGAIGDFFGGIIGDGNPIGGGSGSRTELKVTDQEGNPLEGSAADNSLVFHGVGIGPVGAQTVLQGGTITVTNLDTIGWTVSFHVKNTGTEPVYLNGMIEITERLGVGRFDRVWFRYEPGLGITKNYPETQGIAFTQGPESVFSRLLQPGQRLASNVGFLMDGPRDRVAATQFWQNTGTNEYNMRVTLIQASAPTQQTGRIVADKQFTLAMKTQY